MLHSYLKIALRVFTKYRTYSFINIFGLALGMICSTLTLMWIQDEVSYDRFHENANEMYRVVENQYYAGGELFPVALTPAALAPALKNQFPEVVAATRLAFRNYSIAFSNNPINESGVLVDPEFFEMFSFPFVAGDSEVAFSNPHSIVLTQSTAQRHFSREDVVGRILTVNGNEEFVVSGVVEDIPDQSHLDFDFILPFQFLGELGRDLSEWGRNSFYTYVRLHPEASQELVDSKIVDLIKENNEGSSVEIYLQPLTEIHLYSAGKYTADIGGHGDILYIRIFSVVAFVILFIAAINFMNLSTARSERRSKEVALRKAIGARRSQIISQFFIESIAMSLAAFLLSLWLSNMLVPLFNELTGKQFLMNEMNVSLLLSLLFIAVVTGLLAGAYPAMVLSSFQPASSLKAGANSVMGHAMFRKILVVVQFSLSIIMIIGVFTVSRQVDFIQNKDLGFDRSNLAYVWMNSALRPNYEVFKQELLQVPGISEVTATSQIPTNIVTASSNVDWSGKNPNDEILFHWASVDHDFVNTFRVEMAQGQFFPADMPNNLSSVVINERAAELMGLESPIGSPISFRSLDLTIIGIVKDFNFKPVRTEIEPLMMLMSPASFQAAVLRYDTENLSDTVSEIESVYRQFSLDSPFDIYFLDDSYENLYASEERIEKLSNYFAVIAILISCLGLLGLSAFIAERRTKEVGIRKILGATASQLLLLLSKKFLVLVLVANLISWPIAYLIMSRWLQNYAYHIDLSLLTFMLAGLITVSLVVVTTVFQSTRITAANPVKALHYE